MNTDKKPKKVVEVSDEALVKAGLLGDGASPKLLPALSEAPTILSQPSNASDISTVVAPALVSQFEAKNYWHGISEDPPELLYRSDLDSNPFPLPKPGERWFQLPVKTVCSVSGTALNEVWHEVAPLIVDLFKKRGIWYSVITCARFLIVYGSEDNRKTNGPPVIWVALHPGRNTAYDARDVSPNVLQILSDHGVNGAVVEWYEGVVERL